MPALSPDGTRIVFAARQKGAAAMLYVRRLDTATAQMLSGTEGANFPFWSPDGREVAFGQLNKLKRIDVEGGPAVTLVNDTGAAVRGGSWNRDGVIIYGTNRSLALMRVSASGGAASPVFELETPKSSAVGQPVLPWFLPDGRHFIYTTRQEGDMPVRVASIDEPGTPGKVVAQAHSNAMYADGRLLYLRDHTLMAQPFDLALLQTSGAAVPVAEDVPTYQTPSRGAAFTVSATGLLV